ncbi:MULTISPECIES: glutathione peroxidase [Sporosarcina]|jgi:glutathione peroxidase|uniref:Glutathione peroxidase n=1 Tax=Sporosarcina psychrophila TaxID=1476 RepID=A0ABV2KF03_SPOPS|nr:glutathione peroxidase [Sporosarcina sp. resist]QNK88191.1 glutathione peroxidase [Sporosarcina sp. resist]
MSTVYEFSVKKINGEIQSMEDYKGKPLIIVNTASKCGFTSQFKELQELYEEHKEQGLVVLGFPSDNFNNQEFDDIEKTMEFCEINFGVTFPMFAKVDVKGGQAEPLFTYLTSQKKGMLTEGIKWNFTKFLIDREGNVVERFAPQTSPLKMSNAINDIIQ